MAGQPVSFRSFLDRYAAFLYRYPVFIFLLACGVTALAVRLAARLELRSDFAELLPDSYRSVRDLHRLVKRVGGLGNLVVAVECDNLKASERFADDLVPRLRNDMPPHYVRYVEYNVNEEKAFYQKNRLLYADLKDLEDVRDRFKARIRQEKAKLSPLAIDLGGDEGEQKDAFDLTDIENKYKSKTSRFDKYTDGYFVGENGHLLAILVKPYGTMAGIDFSRKLVAATEQQIAALHPASYDPSMKVVLTGKYRTSLDEYQSIVDDIFSTTAFTVVLVFLSIYAFYRTLGAFLSLGIAVGMGAAWAFALAYLHIGYVNSETAFLGSIIVGNGINYGLIFMARYQEERQSGVESATALASSIRNTILATATASLATCVAFGTLMATSFKGFNQFGFIGGVGMVLCWLASFTVLPACVVLYERVFLRSRGWAGGRPRRPWIAAGAVWTVSRWGLHTGIGVSTGAAVAAGLLVWGLERLPRRRVEGGEKTWLLVGPASRAVERRPGLLLAISGALVAASVVLVVRFVPNSFDYNFSDLLNGKRKPTPAEKIKGRVDAIFGQSLTPAVILADSLDQVQAIQAEVLRKRDAEPAGDRIVDGCKTLFDYLPTDQEQKLSVLHEIQGMMTDANLALLKPDQRKQAEDVRTEISGLKRLGLKDLPAMVTRNFEELDGKLGLIVYVYPRPDANLWDGRRLIRFAEEVRETHLPSGQTIYTSGEAVIFADILKAVAHDAPRAAVVSVAGVLLLLLISFRNLHDSMIVMGSLLGGVVLMGGAMALFDVKLNFFNFVVIPITLGIGVDYAVNVYQRYRLEGPGSAGLVIRRSGGAVVLCSMTTMIGYCALIIARNAAMTSFGWMANFGEFACLFTAIFSVPAYLVWRERRKPPTGAAASDPVPLSRAEAGGSGDA